MAWGALALSRFARTAPEWAAQTRRGTNPASFEWKTKAIANGNYYQLSGINASPNVILPTVAAGYSFSIGVRFKPTASLPIGLWEIVDTSGNDILALEINAANAVQITFGAVGYVGSVNITPNSWNYVLMTIQDNVFTIYVNDVAWSHSHSVPANMSTAVSWRLGVARTAFFEGLITEAWVASGWQPTASDATILYNGGSTFDLTQTIAPINPMLGYMTAWWNGQNTGTTAFFGQARSYWSTKVAGGDLAWVGNGGGIATLPSVSATRPANRSNTYSRLATLASLWASGTAIDSKTPLGVGVVLEASAPHFLPYPQTGWGIKAGAGSFTGVLDVPRQTPQLAISGTLQEQGQSAWPNVGDGTLQYALDGRTVNRLLPTFAKKS